MPTKTLLIRFGSLGDLALVLPALWDLAASEPDGERHFLVLEPWASLLTPLSALDRLWTLPRGAGRAELSALGRSLAGEGFDRVLDFHGNLRSRLLHRQLGRPPAGWWSSPRHDLRRRLMIARPGWPAALRLRAPLTPVWLRHRHLVEKALGPDYRPARPETARYPLAPGLRASVDAELAALGLAPGVEPIALAPGAAWPAKAWPHAAALAERLAGRRPLLLLGGPGDREACAALAALGAIDYSGDRPLSHVAAALARARILVANDSGLVHLAEAVGLPVLALFGPTVPAFGFAPRLADSQVIERALACRPCSLHGEKPCRFGHGNCLAEIGVESLLAELAQRGALQ